MNSLNHTFLELITGNPNDSIDEIVAGSNLGLFKGLKNVWELQYLAIAG